MLNLAVLDCLVGNVDRHTRNFGLFYNSLNGEYQIPLIFDNGMGLFEHDYYRDNYRTFEAAMAEVRLINNLKGILYYIDTPLIDFEIKERELIKAEDLSKGQLYPWELAKLGVSYGSFNQFFQRRTMREGCMFYREHLRALGMDKMDFDLYIRKNNGNNHLDNYWVKFEDFGAKCFAEV